MTSKRILIIAGEASGDVHGGHLVDELRRLSPSTRFIGIGGDRMAKSGVDLYAHAQEMGVVGIAEIVPKLGVILRAYRKTVSLLREGTIDLLLLIDYPGFNLRVAGAARKAGVPVVYYISPQVWAWKAGRVRTLAERVTRMMVIFPFEVEIFRKAGLACDFVGHPLVDDLEERTPDRPPTIEEAKRRLNLDPAKPVIGLFPGSRPGEVTPLLPVLMEAARDLRREFNGLQTVIAVAPTLDRADLERETARFEMPIRWVEGDSYGGLAASDFVIAASGTVTLEAALMGRPMAIVYRVSPMTWWLARRLVQVDHIGLPNIVAGKRIVPELLQEEANPARIAEEAGRVLRDPAYAAEVHRELEEVRRKLGAPGASARAAQIVSEYL